MTDTIYRLKISLKGAKPPIWRRIEVPGDTDLERLHWIIQAAMGWEGYHLYDFDIRGTSYTDAETAAEMGDATAAGTTLGAQIRRANSRFAYTYDFGDDWEHRIEVEALAEPEAGVDYPRCVAGRRACPPEDCGGIWGYEELLAVMKDPESDEHHELLEWLGDGFDPAAFDVEAINEELGRMSARRS